MEHQRCGDRLAIVEQGLRIGAAGGAHGGIRDRRRTGTEARARAVEQRVARGDVSRGRTLVGAERQRGVGIPAGREVGGDVAAAEAVDRLLRVAHHRQQAALRAAAVAVEAIKQGVLRAVGVLELIHQCDGPTGEHRVGQRRMRLLHHAAHLLDQAVEAHLADLEAAGLLHRAQLRPPVTPERALGAGGLFDARGEGAHGRAECGVEQDRARGFQDEGRRFTVAR